MFYLVKTPRWLKKLYGSCTWDIPSAEKSIYLTFDDGPHPTITPFVLDELRKYGAKATFFCIGKNVAEHPAIYQRILDEGHAVGNHTHNHLKGWKTDDKEYLANITEAKKWIGSKLFRPPYGRIRRSQARELQGPDFRMQVIMWDVLSGDFDISLSKEKCLSYVLQKSKPGSIIVFHDSEKAFERMSFALSGCLQNFSAEGYQFKEIVLETLIK